MKKRIVSLLLTGTLAMSMFVACGETTESEQSEGTQASESVESSEEAEVVEGEVYEIGVLQLIQHDALDAANEGFIAALDEAGLNYEVDQQNASGDTATTNTIAEKFVTEEKDLILAIATPAAQAVQAKTEDIPVVGTAITDYVDAKLAESNEAPGYNITGSSDLNPVDVQLALMLDLVPDAETVGVFYSADEPNSEFQAGLFEAEAIAAGLVVERFTISNSNEIDAVVRSMAGVIDACYIPTDNKLASGMGTVSQAANEIGLPVICGEGNMVENGGLATYGLDYYELGYIAGEMAVDILVNGSNPAEMPIQFLPEEGFALIVNEDTAAELGIDLSVLE